MNYRRLQWPFALQIRPPPNGAWACTLRQLAALGIPRVAKFPPRNVPQRNNPRPNIPPPRARARARVRARAAGNVPLTYTLLAVNVFAILLSVLVSLLMLRGPQGPADPRKAGDADVEEDESLGSPSVSHIGPNNAFLRRNASVTDPSGTKGHGDATRDLGESCSSGGSHVLSPKSLEGSGTCRRPSFLITVSPADGSGPTREQQMRVIRSDMRGARPGAVLRWRTRAAGGGSQTGLLKGLSGPWLVHLPFLTTRPLRGSSYQREGG